LPDIDPYTTNLKIRFKVANGCYLRGERLRFWGEVVSGLPEKIPVSFFRLKAKALIAGSVALLNASVTF